MPNHQPFQVSNRSIRSDISRRHSSLEFLQTGDLFDGSHRKEYPQTAVLIAGEWVDDWKTIVDGNCRVLYVNKRCHVLDNALAAPPYRIICKSEKRNHYK